MNLPFLKKVYLPESGSKPQYEKLYHEILTFQKEKDWSGQMYLPKPDSLERGQFQCHEDITCDPFEDMPFKIAFDDVEFSENLTFSANEKKKLLSTPTSGSGFFGNLEIADSYCELIGSSGTLKLKRAWVSEKKIDDGTYEELYEGYFQFNAKYGPVVSGKGFGTGGSLSSGIWGVRAARDPNGTEIGLGPL